MGEVRPENRQRRGVGEGLPPRADPAEGPPVPLRRRPRVTPGVWTAPRREEERPESARTKLPSSRQRQEGCAQVRGEQPPAAVPSPGPAARAPRHPRRAAPSRADPLRLAREPLPSTKPPLGGQSLGPLPAAASPGLLPDKKVIGLRPPWGPRLGSLGWTHHSGSRSFTSRTSTCLARSDSDSGCPAFS